MNAYLESYGVEYSEQDSQGQSGFVRLVRPESVGSRCDAQARADVEDDGWKKQENLFYVCLFSYLHNFIQFIMVCKKITAVYSEIL